MEQNGVDLDLQEGGTYTFDWSDSSAQGHPIRFSLTNDGTHSNGTSAGSDINNWSQKMTVLIQLQLQ